MATKMQEEIVSVSSKGQIVLPSDVRNRLDIHKGRKLVLVEKDGVIIMKPMKKLSELAGILKTDEDISKVIRQLRKEWDLELE